MGNWNFKTLVLSSYTRSTNVWLRQLPDKVKRKELETRNRIEEKLDCIYEELEINKRYLITGKMIKDSIEREHNKKGFWNFQ